MVWDDEVAELERRREMARQMGGAESVAFQHSRGKLTARERLDLLVDKGSFAEFSGLMGRSSYDEQGNLLHVTPKGEVNGVGRIDGRKVVITAGDFTVRGGSGSGSTGQLGEELRANHRAKEWQIPLIRLLDAAGGSVRGFEELGRTYMPDGNIWSTVDSHLLSEVPVVSAVMGSVAGLPAVNACMAHWNVMVDETSCLFPGGPPVVKAAMGYDITKEDLGGPHIHTRISGSVDNLATSEEDALAQIRRFLSYLPSSVWDMAPKAECTDPVDRIEPELRSLIPRSDRRVHNARRLLELVLDEGSFFEIAPDYGRSRITGLARLGGYPVGVMTNNPLHGGGATDVHSGSKVLRLLQLCNTFHLPIVSLADEPGFMVGLDSEKQGIERAGARLMTMTNLTQMPWITIVLRRLYGVAGQIHHRPTGMFRRYAWPSSSWGSMHIAGGASAAYKREIADAEVTGQDIIDPAEARPLLCDFVEDAQRVLSRQLGPSNIPYLP